MAANRMRPSPEQRSEVGIQPVGEAGFAGFPPEAFDLYAGLSQDNTKEFWAAHEQQYRQCVRKPMLALLACLEHDFGSGRLFRPNRDVRFSSDKRPYKDHQGAFVQTATNCGFYAQIDADALLIGAGWYSSTPDQVARYRASVMGPAGAELASLRSQMASAGYQIGGEILRSRPRGVPADHPRLDLLRHRTFTVHKEFPSDTPWIATADVAQQVRRIWTDVTPLLQWLGDHAAGPEPSQT